jgi:hypothetical protein
MWLPTAASVTMEVIVLVRTPKLPLSRSDNRIGIKVRLLLPVILLSSQTQYVLIDRSVGVFGLLGEMEANLVAYEGAGFP